MCGRRIGREEGEVVRGVPHTYKTVSWRIIINNKIVNNNDNDKKKKGYLNKFNLLLEKISHKTLKTF